MGLPTSSTSMAPSSWARRRRSEATSRMIRPRSMPVSEALRGGPGGARGSVGPGWGPRPCLRRTTRAAPARSSPPRGPRCSGSRRRCRPPVCRRQGTASAPHRRRTSPPRARRSRRGSGLVARPRGPQPRRSVSQLRGRRTSAFQVQSECGRVEGYPHLFPACSCPRTRSEPPLAYNELDSHHDGNATCGGPPGVGKPPLHRPEHRGETSQRWAPTCRASWPESAGIPDPGAPPADD